MSEEATSVSAANNDFTQDVHKHLATTSAENAIVSPLSLHVVLVMVSYGASGSTAHSMKKSLRIKHSKSSLNNYKDLMDQLNKSPDMKIAIKIYLPEDVKLNPNFQSTAVNNFNSELGQVNFAQGDEAAHQMNSWVSKHTNEKIKDLVRPSSLSGDTKLVLINAIHFRGEWVFPFKRNDTQDGPFYLDNNTSIQVPLMHQKQHFDLYSEDGDDGFKMLELPYLSQEDQKFYMHIFLPNKRDGLPALEKKLFATNESFAEKFEKIVQDAHSTDVVVTLPRFRIESTWNMNELLKKLGMEIAFTPDADFSLMTENQAPLVISDVIQKAFLEVNEEGSEAAAATEVRMMLGSAGPSPESVSFTADHPFVLTISHEKKHIVFIGKVAKLLLT